MQDLLLWGAQTWVWGRQRSSKTSKTVMQFYFQHRHSVCGLPSYVRAKPATPELYTAISTAHLEGEYRWKTYPACKKKTAVLLPITKWDLLLILSFPTHQKGGKLCKPSRWGGCYKLKISRESPSSGHILGNFFPIQWDKMNCFATKVLDKTWSNTLTYECTKVWRHFW